MYGRKRKSVYHPETLECRFIDITENDNELQYLIESGWVKGMVRKVT